MPLQLNSKFILLPVLVKSMRTNDLVLAALALILVSVLSSGCTGNNSVPDTITTPAITTPTPVPVAIDLYKKGFDANINGNYTVALDFFNQSIAADPRYAWAWVDRGAVLIKLNRTAEAISSYDSALALNTDDAMLWNSRGEGLMAMGNYTAARESFDKALQIEPEYIAAKQNRDLVLKKLP